MTSRDTPPDAACDACRRSAGRVAELEAQLEAVGVTPELSALLAQLRALMTGPDLRTHLLRTAAERDQLAAKLDHLIARTNLTEVLTARVNELSDLLIRVSDRCRAQSELLARAGERAAGERRRCAEIARRNGAAGVARLIEGRPLG